MLKMTLLAKDRWKAGLVLSATLLVILLKKQVLAQTCKLKRVSYNYASHPWGLWKTVHCLCKVYATLLV